LNNQLLKTFVQEMKEAYPDLLPALDNKELNIAKLVIETKMGGTERIATGVGKHTKNSLIQSHYSSKYSESERIEKQKKLL
jgi:hypothetical protein